jgi:hypothetical protein
MVLRRYDGRTQEGESSNAKGSDTTKSIPDVEVKESALFDMIPE